MSDKKAFTDYDSIPRRMKSVRVVEKLGIRFVEFDKGMCTIDVPHDRDFDGIYESYHGGLLATVADCVACFAIMTVTGPHEHLTTTDLHVRYLAPCRTDVRAVGTVHKVGRTLCPVHVELFDMNGTKVAIAQVTYMRLGKGRRDEGT